MTEKKNEAKAVAEKKKQLNPKKPSHKKLIE
jgi:hypothetical protein